MKDTLLKVVIWRILSIVITLSVVYLMTGDIVASSWMTAVLHVVLVFCHFSYEVLWEKYYEARKSS